MKVRAALESNDELINEIENKVREKRSQAHCRNEDGSKESAEAKEAESASKAPRQSQRLEACSYGLIRLFTHINVGPAGLAFSDLARGNPSFPGGSSCSSRQAPSPLSACS